MVEQTSDPVRKVSIGAAVGAIVTVLTLTLDTYILPSPVPGALSSALTVIAMFVAGYVTNPGKNEVVVTAPSGEIVSGVKNDN